MAADQKHVILAKHVFKQYSTPYDTSHTKDAFAIFVFPIHFSKRRRKNVTGSDVITETGSSKIWKLIS